MYLKQSTAVTIKLGPFVDETDGKTAETGLTIAQADVRLSKNGGNMAQKAETTSCTHDEIGIYDCPLDTTDTGTLGTLEVFVHEGGALPVWKRFVVLPANIYDSFIAGTDTFDVQVTGMGAGTITAAAIATDAIDADAMADGAITAGTFAAGAITATVIATDAIDADALADNAITAATFAADAITAAKLAADVTTELQSGLATAAAVAALNDLSAAEVNAEVADVFSTDTHAEPAQGTPGATISYGSKIDYLYKAWRNKSTQTASEYALFADDGTTKDHEAAVTDDGTTFTRGEVTTGA